METNKYYTPSIEEFHIGFEYERKLWIENNTKSIWEKRKVLRAYEISSIDMIIRDVKMDGCSIRVKYLDAEDIESLGFTYTGKSIDIWFKKEGTFNIGSWTSYEIKLHYGLHDNRLYIITMDCGDEYKLFEGKIKNKSELKKVLEMLNIKHD